MCGRGREAKGEMRPSRGSVEAGSRAQPAVQYPRGRGAFQAIESCLNSFEERLGSDASPPLAATYQQQRGPQRLGRRGAGGPPSLSPSPSLRAEPQRMSNGAGEAPSRPGEPTPAASIAVARSSTSTLPPPRFAPGAALRDLFPDGSALSQSLKRPSTRPPSASQPSPAKRPALSASISELPSSSSTTHPKPHPARPHTKRHAELNVWLSRVPLASTDLKGVRRAWGGEERLWNAAAAAEMEWLKGKAEDEVTLKWAWHQV
jgi:hypothetical protein